MNLFDLYINNLISYTLYNKLFLGIPLGSESMYATCVFLILHFNTVHVYKVHRRELLSSQLFKGGGHQGVDRSINNQDR